MIKTNGYSEREKEMARNEIRNLKSSQHENLVRYVNDFYENGCFLIVMEFCSSGDLADAIKSQNGKPFSVDILLTWFGQLTSALKYLQENKLIHRDLKPAKCVSKYLPNSEDRRFRPVKEPPDNLRGQDNVWNYPLHGSGGVEW